MLNESKFYCCIRYDKEHSLAFEMQLFLHPTFKHLQSIHDVVETRAQCSGILPGVAGQKAAAIIEKVEYKVMQLALRAAIVENDSTVLCDYSVVESHTSSIDEVVTLGWAQPPSASDAPSINLATDIVRNELLAYKKEKLPKNTSILEWWKSKESTYLNLATAA